jgi:hypothetical protein
MSYDHLKHEQERLLNELLEEQSRKQINILNGNNFYQCKCLAIYESKKILPLSDFSKQDMQNRIKIDYPNEVGISKEEWELNERIRTYGMSIPKDDSSPEKRNSSSDSGTQSNPVGELTEMSDRNYFLNRNSRILKLLLFDDDIASFDYDDLVLLRYAFDVYDYEMEDEEQLPFFKVGPYALLLRKDAPCGVTFAENLDKTMNS